LQLVEIEDLAWCPAAIRDAITDFLRLMMEWFAPYRSAGPILARALAAVHETTVVDLCSGSGGPWLDLLPWVQAHGPPVRVTLTDRFPNVAAFARMKERSGGAIAGDLERVDAAAVPERLAGFRTLFTALHHFPPEAAHAILADAVARRRSVAVFELTRRSLLALLGMLFLPPMLLVYTPFIRPFRWSRLLWTYLIPVLLPLVWFDGTVSCLRTYTPEDLRDLVADLQSGYAWEIGTVRAPPLFTRVTYLVGTPISSSSATAARSSSSSVL
jgi:hypothetical protein